MGVQRQTVRPRHSHKQEVDPESRVARKAGTVRGDHWPPTRSRRQELAVAHKKDHQENSGNDPQQRDGACIGHIKKRGSPNAAT